MFSKSCEYGLQAMIYIALHGESQRKVRLEEIANALLIPQPFLSKVLQLLVRHNIIGSLKGRSGGYYLLKPAKKITLIDIIKTIDGIKFLDNCSIGINNCSDKNPCPFHDDFKQIKERYIEVLKNKSLGDLGDNIRFGKSNLDYGRII